MPLVVEFCTFVQDIVSFLDCHRVWNNSLEINIIPNNIITTSAVEQHASDHSSVDIERAFDDDSSVEDDSSDNRRSGIGRARDT